MSDFSTDLVLLVHPGSRFAKGANLDRLRRLLTTAGYRVGVRESVSAQDAEEVAAACRPGELLAVLGGDGTLSAAARGVARSKAVLLPLPGGRGNDLCRYLGIGLDPFTAAQLLPSYRVQSMDAGSIDGQLYLGVATLGFDSVANAAANRSRLPGDSVYAWAALTSLIRWQPMRVPLVVDGAQLEHRGWSVIVGNTGRYGGGMRICPDARTDDGLLDLLLVGEVSKREFVRSLKDVFAGTHLDNPHITYRKVRSVQIGVPTGVAPAAAKDLIVYADGEAIAPAPVTISVVPAALKVLAPAAAPGG